MLRRFQRWSVLTLAACCVVLAIPAAAAASVAVNAPTLLFPWQQIWPLVIGAVVPLATYVLNHVGPWISEPIKAGVLVVVSAAATALYTALATNVIGFNTPTLQLILTGVAGALAAHHWLWKPSGISLALGGGTNRQRVAAAPPPGPAGPPVAPVVPASPAAPAPPPAGPAV